MGADLEEKRVVDEMRPLSNFSGKWNPAAQAIQFQWDPSTLENDRYVHIVSVNHNEHGFSVDVQNYTFLDLRTAASLSSATMKIRSGLAGVFKMYFFAFSTATSGTQDDAAVIQACEQNPSLLSAVMVGQANLLCVIGTSTQENAKVVTFEITSDCAISDGVLGFQYPCDNMRIVTAFPGPIKKGKNVFPPVLIPKDCAMQVVPCDKQFVGNLNIKEKNKLFNF